MRPWDVPRASPVGPSYTGTHPVGAPPAPIGDSSRTPRSRRGAAVVVWNGTSLDWYTTYAVEPSGAMAGAEYSGRSFASETAAGTLHVPPWLVEYETIAFSLPAPRAPSVQESMISSVASDPSGAPLAMSTLGMAARSVRAPAIPSSTHR